MYLLENDTLFSIIRTQIPDNSRYLPFNSDIRKERTRNTTSYIPLDDRHLVTVLQRYRQHVPIW